MKSRNLRPSIRLARGRGWRSLLLYTGQRRGDVIRMGRQQVRDGFIGVRQQKTGTVLEIPILAGLREVFVLQPGRAFDLFNNQSGGAFQGAGLHKLVPRYVSRGGLATWRYTKAADQKRMATAAMEAASKTKTGTNTGKPLTKVSQISSQPIENKA
jgi:hypothetical protein